MSLINLNNLSFAYKTTTGEKIPVLRNINLSIQAGELVAIQGPSGSGKSTLLYIIGCLLNSYSGQVLIGGHDISKLSDEELANLRNKHIGFVFQHFHLLPKATVLENVLLPSQYPVESQEKNDSGSRALELIDELGLSERSHHLPNQLSGGQQQRVAIARALLNNAQIILADEPTGSLDSRNSEQIMELLKKAHRSGRTVIIITHDSEIAQQCDKIVHIRDGEIKEINENKKAAGPSEPPDRASNEIKDEDIASSKSTAVTLKRYVQVGFSLIPLAFQNLKQNRSRSILTMIGVVIGVAAILSMVTIGTFTKRKILDSYAQMGVNRMVFYGYPNWELRATDEISTVFQSFNWEKDLAPLKRIFPEILRLSPILYSWDNQVNFGGKVMDSDVRVLGVSSEGLAIANRDLLIGKGFTPFHIEYRSPVCIIGYEIYQRLFSNISPIGQIIAITQSKSSFGCRVIGVLTSKTSNVEWNKPNLQIYLPYTFFQATSNPWSSRIYEVTLQLKPGSDVEKVGKKIKAYFDLKYGKSGRFIASSDSVLIAQMNKFLNLFTVLLAAIALVSLGVGGIGITNMMLVSVSERLKEIGIRKAFGATNFSIRVQYLVESVLICGIAGIIGIFVGFVLYQSAIYGATKLINNLSYEWTIDITALSISIISIFIVGILSGLKPALRAEKLQVIEALRSE